MSSSTDLATRNPSSIDHADTRSPDKTAMPSSDSSFPSSMKMCNVRVKTFDICNQDGNEKLYTVEVHTGYSGRGPLGTRPGVVLYNGTSTKNRILGAAGDTSQIAANPLNIESIILLPPLNSTSPSRELVTEKMRAGRSNEQVTFTFTIEVAYGKKMSREQFQWIKINQGAEKKTYGAGYKLICLSRPSKRTDDTGPHIASCPVPTPNNDDPVALLTWKSRLNLFELFTLKFMGIGESGVLGQRWALMVVLTSLRLWQLRLNGRTALTSIIVGERIAGM
jgi:hypothetical protein